MDIYKALKKILLQILPKKYMFKYEYYLRYFFYLGYIGEAYKCNICEKKLKSFATEKDICPRCGSIPRTRKLWDLIRNEFLFENCNLLHFSPSRSLYRILKKEKINYVSSDYEGEFIAEQSYDIKNINVESNFFDIVICYHILEHIDDDRLAISELYRVIKKGGYCIVQTPFKEGEIYEDVTIVSSEDREKYFGQHDHVRIYSVNGLIERLRNTGFDVQEQIVDVKENNLFGFKKGEIILICSKF